eukprot:CAMPEP_0203771302 /NCGR_PEP_ID=MMETSP0099_2-20121227/3324_1 /ASSEMBLY_ACC=CAM_ASM_000209 /TAXON_ID=96639 /ORGANISM=" , Strain NY0313808BC1" /LENGTH=498 /DNA_ID=CAMNT_0050668601 /DNA_START=307 /DNA_END=1803 /DNA_ORIENTATION=+
MAGPATSLAWLIAGFCCAITALAYCEISAMLCTCGSTYAFSYHGLGEIFAVVAAWLITLEYGVSGAAVARSWGDKVAYWFMQNKWTDCTADNCFINKLAGTQINPAACLLSCLVVTVILSGVKIEKLAVNIMTTIKMLLVLFVTITGCFYFNSDNLTPFIPGPGEYPDGSTDHDSFMGGMSGILLGATSAFFGFIGFDEISCMTGEALRPKRDIPVVILLTIGTLIVLYFAISLVLVGMVPYDKIDQDEGFGSAFVYVGADWAMQITLVGEILFVLPTVVLVAYLPESRIIYSVSQDGHLPRILSRVKPDGTIFNAGLVSGVSMTVIATLVPFKNLNDLISGGILLSFIFTNSSLIMIRTKQQGRVPLLTMVISMLVACLIANKCDVKQTIPLVFLVIFCTIAIGSLCFMCFKYSFKSTLDTFKVPFVPVVPALAIAVNWFLLTQLSFLGMGLIFALVGLALICYFSYGYSRSANFDMITDHAQIDPEIVGEPQQKKF